MNLGCGAIAFLLALVLGAGALFVAVPAHDSDGAAAGPVVEASAQP